MGENVSNESKKRTASDSGISDNDTDLQPPTKKIKLATQESEKEVCDDDVEMDGNDDTNVENSENVKEIEETNQIEQAHIKEKFDEDANGNKNENLKENEEVNQIKETNDENIDEDVNEDENEEEEEGDDDLDIESMTVFELKNQLRTRGLKLGGNKAESKQRLMDAMSEDNN